jgi:hypothetical protein
MHYCGCGASWLKCSLDPQLAIFRQLAEQRSAIVFTLSQALVALEMELRIVNIANNALIVAPEPAISIDVCCLTRSTDVITTHQDHLYCCDDDAADN